MVKTRKGLVSLVLAVVMIAALLIPFVGPASANVTYTMTNVKKIYNTGKYVGTYQGIGQIEFTFDSGSWNLASKPYDPTNTNFIYLQLPTTTLGYAFSSSGITSSFNQNITSNDYYSNVSGNVYEYNNSTPVYTSATPLPTGPLTATISGGTGIVTVVGQSPTTNPAAGYQTLAIYITNTTPAVSTSGVEVTVQLPKLAAPTGVNGAVTCSVSTGGSSSMFSGGASSLQIATVGAGTVTLATESTPAITDISGAQALGIMDIKENSQGALYVQGSDTPVLSLTLPPGFTWNTTGLTGTIPAGYVTPPVGGEFNDMSTADSNYNSGTYSGQPDYQSFDTLASAYTTESSGNPYGWETSNNGSELDLYNASYASTGGQWIQFNPQIIVSNASQATSGPINVTVTGLASSTVSTLEVATYSGSVYSGTSATVGTPATIVAGKAAQAVGEISLTESAPGSLVWGRTITLTLPSGCAWAQAPTLDNGNSTNTGTIETALNSGNWTAVGNNGNEIQCSLTVPAGITSQGPTAGLAAAGTFDLMDAEVTTAVDFTGPVTATVGGSEGLTGNITLANVSAGISASVSSAPTAQIGTASQTLGDITISEAAARSLDSTIVDSGLVSSTGSAGYGLAYHVAAIGGQYAEIDVIAPPGVTFVSTPAVSVTAGNVQLGTVTSSTGATINGTTYAGNQGTLQIPIDAISSSASTIKIAAPVVTLDNTVPSGPVTFKIEGTAVNETMLGNLASSTSPTYSALFPNDTAAASLTVANVGTGIAAATTQTSGAVVFMIGQASYTVNGTVYNIDEAPYIKDSRTFLPLRAVAESLGVADSNVLWDSSTQKVTIIKGSMVVQLTIGSTTMLLNGASITMDTAPEITGGRTCLPVAWVAKALGANIQWDATNQTVIITG